MSIRNDEGTYSKPISVEANKNFLKPHSHNGNGDFIHGWYIDEKICDGVIEYFNEDDPDKMQGVFGNKDQANKDKKDSIDLPVSPNNDDPRITAYLQELAKALNHYIDDFPVLNNQSPWRIESNFNVQWYPKGGGYKVWHHERDAFQVSTRMLVFMTYLNTVTDHGGTEWKYQKRIINAEKGLTVFWPTDFTHVHKGVVSPTQEKYIATGWYHFRGPFEFTDEKTGEKRIFDGRNIR